MIFPATKAKGKKKAKENIQRPVAQMFADERISEIIGQFRKVIDDNNSPFHNELNRHRLCRFTVDFRQSQPQISAPAYFPLVRGADGDRAQYEGNKKEFDETLDGLRLFHLLRMREVFETENGRPTNEYGVAVKMGLAMHKFSVRNESFYLFVNRAVLRFVESDIIDILPYFFDVSCRDISRELSRNELLRHMGEMIEDNKRLPDPDGDEKKLSVSEKEEMGIVSRQIWAKMDMSSSVLSQLNPEFDEAMTYFNG